MNEIEKLTVVYMTLFITTFVVVSGLHALF